jgi:RimJ/RimL family protein N-acetyltransferase
MMPKYAENQEPLDLLPGTWKAIHFWRKSRRPGAILSQQYQNLPDSERLSYELLTWENATQLGLLFEQDANPFVDTSFKSRDKREAYVADQLEFGRYSFKRGACDWLLRLRAEGTYVGVLHLYNLSWELVEGKHPACWFGYAIAAPFRRCGLALEAGHHLLKHIPTCFNRYEAMAEPLIANEASRALLTKLGLTEWRVFRDGKSSLWHKQVVDSIPLRTLDDLIQDEKVLEQWTLMQQSNSSWPGTGKN